MKDPKTIDQQVQILIDRGLIVSDIEIAKEFLNQVNYYRFSGYLKLFSANDKFNENTTFENIVEVYNFDCELRKLLYIYLGYIEVLIKTQLALNLSLNIDAIFYLNKNNFLDEDRFDRLQNDINDSNFEQNALKEVKKRELEFEILGCKYKNFCHEMTENGYEDGYLNIIQCLENRNTDKFDDIFMKNNEQV